MSKRQLPLTEADRAELLQSVQLRRNNWVTYAPYLDMINEALANAELIPEDRWGDAAALDTVVLVRHPATVSVDSWRLVRPQDEDCDDGRLSVLSPLGWELLGAREGDTVHAATPTGIETYVVEQVTSPSSHGRLELAGR